MTTPEPDDVELDQLPEGQRRYIDDTEVGELRGKGFRIYTGKQKGTYVDATAEWIDAHKQKQEPIQDKDSTFVGLVPHPEHGHDVYEYENGDKATHAEAPRHTEPGKNFGKRIPKKRDEKGNLVRVEQKEALNHGDTKVPLDAVDVHVAVDKDLPVQAKWRNAKTGELGYSYNPTHRKNKKVQGWKDFRTNKGDIQKGI